MAASETGCTIRRGGYMERVAPTHVDYPAYSIGRFRLIMSITVFLLNPTLRAMSL